MGACARGAVESFGLDPDRRQRSHNFHRFQTHRNDLPDQPHDIFRVVGAVRVVGDAAALVGRDLVLIDHPLQRRAVAEAVFVGFGRDAAESEELVVEERVLSLLRRILVTRQSSFSPAFSLFVSGYSDCFS